MLVNGPAEWSEAQLATAAKADLLQHGYNARLRTAAMPLGASVAITRFAGSDGDSIETPGFAHEVMNQAEETVVLHQVDATSDTTTDTRYRLAAWSRGSSSASLLAIASIARVEIWEVALASGKLTATMKGSVGVARARGLAWNPRADILLIYSDKEVALVDAAQPVLQLRPVYERKSSLHDGWRACSWSPCGLTASIALNHELHFLSWTSEDALLKASPIHEQTDVRSSSADTSASVRQLEVASVQLGAIAAIARVSPAVCIVTTDTKLVLEDMALQRPTNSKEPSRITELADITPLNASNSCAQLPRTQGPPATQEHVGGEAPSGTIDLTSLRISASSSRSSLQILNRTEDIKPQQQPPRAKARSHLHVLTRKGARWSIARTLELSNLATPDVLVTQDMRVVVGSTLAPRLLAAHLECTESGEWRVSLSGELKLPPTHVSRGLYLAERSPFLQVASSEKRKRAAFFHAAANDGPQPIYLSTFKVPRRKAGVSSRTSPLVQSGAADAAAAASTTDKTPKSCAADAGQQANPDVLARILMAMEAMQTQLNARFDAVDKTLRQVAARVEQLERKL